MTSLAAHLRDELDELGFTIIHDVFDPHADLDPILDELAGILRELELKLPKDNCVAQVGETFARRLIRAHLISELDLSEHFDIGLPSPKVAEDTPMNFGDAAFALVTHPRLLDVVEGFIGPEIALHPINHIRMKLPAHAVPDGAGTMIATTPYHQDAAVLLPEADATNMVIAWIPITDATVANGTLCVVPGSHRLGLIAHEGLPLRVAGPETALGEPLPLEVERGDVVVMSRLVVHGSVPNTTNDEVRVSAELRYQPVGQPTGRVSEFPVFPVRSRRAPEGVIASGEAWRTTWETARRQLARYESIPWNRWGCESPSPPQRPARPTQDLDVSYRLT